MRDGATLADLVRSRAAQRYSLSVPLRASADHADQRRSEMNVEAQEAILSKMEAGDEVVGARRLWGPQLAVDAFKLQLPSIHLEPCYQAPGTMS